MRRIFDLGLYIARRKLSQLNNFAAGLKIERGEVFFADGYENRDEREREREKDDEGRKGSSRFIFNAMLLLPSFFFRGRDSPTFEKTSPFEKILQND